MAFSSYDELKAAVAKRRAEILTLEVDLGTDYSPEYEEAKQELAQAKAIKAATGGGFLGDPVADLEARVASLKPEPNSVWIQYRKLDLGEWAALLKSAGGNMIDQYEKVLPKTFVGVYGQDPVKPDDWAETHPDEVWEQPEPLSTNGALLSTKGNDGILPGGALHSVVQNFMAWQNSGGRCHHPPYEVGPRLGLLLDMALVSGRPPVRLLDEGSPDTWTELDLEVVSQWKALKEAKCSGCGRPLSQHIYNSRLGREETIEDYMAWSMECPAQQAIAIGQDMWNTAHKSEIEAHNKGQGPDPRLGTFWLSQREGEALPRGEQ
ncbi:tail assembly chaperone [Microbacterium phage Schimmels22]|nr:tail assembly chaperone [Microbacterium phage Schimmels22]